jgi:hypothetical protein
MADIISEVLPHLQTLLNDHCLIVFPVGGSHELRIYYGEYVGEVSASNSEYVYSVRSVASTSYLSQGKTDSQADAIKKIHTIMTALRRPATAA